MANPEHLEILSRGIEAWNKWREEHPDIWPDLKRAYFDGEQFYSAHFTDTVYDFVFLSDADLSRANLNGANLSGGFLDGADLSGAKLYNANLSGSDLNGADFTGAVLGYTMFADNDLSQVKGLETIYHQGPSYLSVDTIYKSRGNLPEVFLRGCGVPESFIVQMHALIASTEPIQFYSCFISYSSKDQDFAERLYADLQSKGVRCWFAPEDIKIGDKFRSRIDESLMLRSEEVGC